MYNGELEFMQEEAVISETLSMEMLGLESPRSMGEKAMQDVAVGLRGQQSHRRATWERGCSSDVCFLFSPGLRGAIVCIVVLSRNVLLGYDPDKRISECLLCTPPQPSTAQGNVRKGLRNE